MRRVLVLAGCAAAYACVLFPSLDDLQGGDAQPPVDTGTDIGADGSLVDAGGDAAVCGFPVGPSSGLVAYYAFDEGQGLLAHDCTANQLDGTFVRQDVGAWVTGKHGGAVRLGAPTGCIELGNSPLLQFSTALTVSAWVDVATYPTLSDLGYVIAKGASIGVSGFRLGLEPSVMLGVKIGQPGDAGPFTVTGPGPAASAWHHIAWTFEAGKIAIYIDGVLLTSSSNGPAKIIDDPSSALTVGCHPGSTTFPFQGIIDEMRLYDRALTPTEVTSLVQ